MAWTCMAASSTGTLVFIDDVTQDRSSQINFVVFRDIMSAQIQLNAVKLIGRRFIKQMDNDPKQPRSLLKQRSGIFLNGQVSHLILTQFEHACHLLKTKLRTERPTYSN